MDKNTYRHTAYQMIRLVRCALTGRTPDREWTKSLDLPVLFEVCENHILTACAAYALEAAGIHDPQFTEAKAKAIRKNILLDAERRAILARLEQSKIWYMPLKGALLKDWYPKLGMRQMSDNDILYDGRYRERVRDILLERGYICDHFGKGPDDAYLKEPVYNFEMHHHLFIESNTGGFHSYYENVKDRLLKDEGNAFGYHFRPEDFYLYMTAHEYKHFAGGGTGVRSLADTYVFIQKYGDVLDWDYLHTELEKMQLTEYERQNRELAMKLFSCARLSEEEKQRLDYYILSGTYGNLKNHVENRVLNTENSSKANYIFHRFFPTTAQLKSIWPFFYRHKWLLPILWIYRPIYGLLFNRKKLINELWYLWRTNSEE